MKAEKSRKSFARVLGAPLTKFCWPTAGPARAPLAQAEELVRTVKVVATALLPKTVVFGKEKQPFVSEGLLETVNVTVPVEPLFGVMVTVEAPVFPAETVTLVAESVNVLLAITVIFTEPLEEAKVESPE